MLAKGSRCMPRFFQRLSLINDIVWKGKGDGALRRSHHLCSGGQCAGLRKVPGHQILQELKAQTSTPIRSFHHSVVFCDEIKIVSTPPFAESITEGDVMWKKAVGDYVAEDEVVAEIETDKTSIDVPSPAAGVIEELFFPDGEKVLAGQELFKLRLSGDAPPKTEAPPAPKAEPPKEAAAPPPPAASAPSSSSGPIPTQSPPVPPIPQQPMSSTPASSVRPVTAAAAAPPDDGALKGARTERRVKMPRIRQRTSQRLKESQNTCAALTTFNEIDMSNVIDLRNKHKDAFLKKHGLKLGFMSAFVRASAYALLDQPVINAVIDGTEIVYRDYIDMSFAVATPKGLVVPVLRDVGHMNYAEIEKGIAELGEKAKNMSLAIEDMDGGTFTISNGGVFGSLYGTPIINLPQSAILGMHAIKDRPMAVNGKVEIRPMMYVALTYDHRLIDGREAVTFLNKIKSAVEDPRVLLLDL